VSLVIPGSQIPFVTEKEKDNATIDIIGEALGGGKLRVGQLRDTVKLAVETTQQVRRKNVQYNTGFVLAPGSYHLKFVIRENQTGRMGSFETDVQVPDLRKMPLKMSSVVLSNLRAPVTNKKNGANPLVRDQMELVRTFRMFSRKTSISIYNTKCTMRQRERIRRPQRRDSERASQGCASGQATEGQHQSFSRA